MELTDAIRGRRSRRALDPVVIDEGILGSLMEAVSLSASCFNNQPWRMVFVRSEAPLDRLKEALNRGNAWAQRASMIVAVCARPEDDCVIGERRYHLFDVGMGVSSMLLRATELGLIAHPIAGYDPEKARDALGIPPDYEVVTLVIVGKRSDDLSGLSEKQVASEMTRPERKPYPETFFKDVWDG